ncbi:hypothetical protein QAD02_011918 [Eretmocerus hayati]|uniref:Uncharacterized protein n=1 Tax=Eretmocerus hayati TaxID=131215 RepID=A0ACC2NYD1_9HYME|nr:hypothetical protein QAD02_011918 [Eretmocerus hayati]
MDEDPRGAKRGACLTPDCGCEAYERIPDKSSCDYCGCPPAKHKKKDTVVDSSSTSKNTPDAANSELYTLQKDGSLILSESDSLDPFDSGIFEKSDTVANGTNSEDRHNNEPSIKVLAIVQDPTEKDDIATKMPMESNMANSGSSTSGNAKNVPPQSHEPKKKSRLDQALEKQMNLLDNQKEKVVSCFPTIWPDDVTEMLSKEKGDSVDDRLLNEMIRLLVEKFRENGLAEKIYFDIAGSVANEKYPVLQSNISTSGESLSAMMRRRLQNSKYYSKNPPSRKEKKSNTASPPTSNQMSLKEVQQKMTIEMQQQNPSVVELKKLLVACREERVVLAKKSDAQTHLRDFPALKVPEILSWEFLQVFKVDPKIMKLRWLEALRKTEILFPRTLVGDENIRNIEVLELISENFYRKNKEASKSILEIYDENTPIENTLPTASEAPRLVGIGSIQKKDLQFAIYVDRVPVYTGSAVDSLVFCLRVIGYSTYRFRPRQK